MGHLEITGTNELALNSRLEIMSRISHPDEYYKQAFIGKGIDPNQLTHGDICIMTAAMKATEADVLMWVADNLPAMPSEEIAEMVNALFNKGWK